MSMSISGMNANMPTIMSGASSRMSPNQKMTNLFQQMDSNNSGLITQAQFAQTFQNANPPVAFKDMGADSVFNSLNQNGSNGVSKQDFVDGMTKLMAQVRNQNSNNETSSSPAQTISNSRSSFDAILGNYINTHA